MLGEIGRGGTGRVLRAYDSKLQREVALKKLGRGVLRANAADRLVAEARAMAKLSHPNVVAVYDVEVTDHGVTLVMEYVPGPTLRAWLRQTKSPRPWEKVVEHFIGAGRGLAAAHAAGMLHRDFKPANVLLTPNGTAKVTDFGLAKDAHELLRPRHVGPQALEPADTADTRTGMVRGTPRYMAPEQQMGEALTDAADQYGFCVTLWEALTGAPPFCGTWEELGASKLEGPPPWPEAVVVPRPIVEALRRGLAVEPNARWPSMTALLRALELPPSRRRRPKAIAAGLVALLGLGGLGGAGLYEWSQARSGRCTGASRQLAGIWDANRRSEIEAIVREIDVSYGPDAWARTAEQLDRYAAQWAAMHREICEATTIRGEQSLTVMDLRMACLHRAKQQLAATTTVLADADAEVVKRAHELVASVRPLSRCADVDALQADVEPPRDADQEAVEEIQALVAEAKAERRAGRYTAAREAIDAARERLARVEYGPVQTEVALEAGHVLDAQGDYEAAEAALLRSLEQAARWRQWESMARASSQLVYVVGYRRRHQAEGLRYRELARGLADGRPRLQAELHNNTAAILQEQGHHEAAEAEHRQALELRQQILDPEHPEIAESLNNLAIVLFRQGRYEEAEAEHRLALALRQRICGPNHPDVAMSLNNLASVLRVQGKPSEASTAYEQAAQTFERALGPAHPHVATSRENLAVVYLAEGRLAQAEAEFRQTLALREQALGLDHPDVATSLNNLATVLHRQGALAEAETHLRRALALKQRGLGPEHPEVAHLQHNLALVLYDQGHAESAVKPAEQSWQRRQRDDLPARARADTAFLLAQILGAARPDDPPAQRRAIALAEQSLRTYAQLGPLAQDQTEQVRTWLDDHR
ncbi:MAG: serine/threonine-protein kinase [Myxococcota bacterium]